jgi:hypothetical protein
VAGLPFKSSSDVFASNCERGLDTGFALAPVESSITRRPSEASAFSRLGRVRGSRGKLLARMRTVSYAWPVDGPS